MDVKIPTSAGDITPEWMTTVLRSDRPNWAGVVTTIQAEGFGASAGAMCEILRCHLQYDPDYEDGPPSVVVKYTGANVQNRAVARLQQLYRREVWFYRQSAVRSPALAHCYAAEYDPTTDEVVLVLEDVVGAWSIDVTHGFTASQATAVVAALASIHSATWQARDVPFPAICAQGGTSASAVESSIERFDAAWGEMRRRAPALLADPEAAAWLVEFGDQLTADRQRTLLTGGQRMPMTLLHGDLHADNILWRRDGSGCVLVDWQTCGAGPVVLDLAYFLSGNAADPASAHACLRAYHAALAPAIRDAYAWDRLCADYHWAVTACLRYGLMLGAAVDLRNAGLRALFGAMITRLTHAARSLPDASFGVDAQG